MFNLLTRYKVVIICFFFSVLYAATPYQNLFKSFEEKPRSSIEGIDGIFVINLDLRPEKWHRMEPMLNFYGVDCVRFPAVVGLDFDIPTIKKYCTKHMRPGQIACMLSHLSLYNYGLKNGLNTIWVIEDDAKIMRDPKILTKIIKELDQIDPDWDILYTDLDFMGSNGKTVRNMAFPKEKAYPFPPHPLKHYTYRKNVSHDIQQLRYRYATTSMIVSKRGMEKVIRHFTTYHDILWPIDIEIHFVPGLRQYGIRNPIATNDYFNFSFSDAGTTRIHKYYEINDENVRYQKEREKLLLPVLADWDNFIKRK